MPIRVFLFIAFWAFLPLSTSTASTYTVSARFERLSLEEGLPQTLVQSIFLDSRGFLWIGTEGGLARYDGYSFKVYKSNTKNAHSLSDDLITDITEDSKGNLWIGTPFGLNRFNPDTNRVKHYRFDPQNHNSLSNDSIYAITVDHKNNLWIGTAKGLNHFNPDSEQFTRYFHNTSDPHSLSDDDVRAVTEDQKGDLWVGTYNGGLNRFNHDTNQFIRYNSAADQNSLTHTRVNVITEDLQGNLWVGTQKGLNRLNPQTKQFIKYQNNATVPRSLSDDNIQTIFTDHRGQLWIGTLSGGLNHFNPDTNDFNHFRFDALDPHSISNDNVLAITEDNQGNLWIGVMGGLNRYNPNNKPFNHYKSISSNRNSTSDSDISAFVEDAQGNLWVGTWYGGLNYLPAGSEVFTNYKFDLADAHSLSHNAVSTLVIDHSGNLWVGTAGGGLNRFNPETETFTHFKANATDPNSLSNDTIRALIVDQQGDLWIGTKGGGLNYFDIAHEKFYRYQYNPQETNGLSSNTLYAITQDRSGILWIGTSDGGLNRFDAATKVFTHYKNSAANLHSLNHNWVMSITEDANGFLWVGTTAGLDRLDKNTGQFKHYNQNDGLPDDVIYGILEDDAGLLWLSTNHGLSQFNPNTDAFKNYDVRDGLQSNEFNGGAHYKNTNGELFFGGIKGFNRFFPHKIEDDTQQPLVVFTDMLLLNKSIPINSLNTKQGQFSLDKAIHATNSLALSHDENLISFEFSALHFTNPRKNKYAYRLEGWDDKWINTDYKNRRATYTNLAAGDYRLRIRASNPDGVWNENGRSIVLQILPPPWRTWWASTLYVLLFASVILGFIRSQRQKVFFARSISLNLEQQVVLRTKNISVLSEIGKEITSNLDFEVILNTVYRHVNEMMDAGCFGIGIYRGEKQLIEYKLAIEKNHRYPPYTRNMQDKNQFAVWCIEHKKPVFINDVDREYIDYLAHPLNPLIELEGATLENGCTPQKPHSMIYIPLLIKEKILGIISVQSFQTNAYDSHHMDMLQTLAAYTAIALENADAHNTLIETQQQLIQAEKMISLGGLTAGVAHEINNPTNFVHVSAQNLAADLAQFQTFIFELAGEDADDEILESFKAQFESLYEHLETIKDGTQRIKIIIRDLRTFSQLDAADHKKVVITDGLQSTINLVRTKNRAVAKFVTHFESNPELLCYPAQLNQVFMNLIVNACDAIREKSREHNLERPGQVTVTCRSFDDSIEITVKDDGNGMSEQTKNKLFEPFYTTKAIGEGTGLGLSISYGIVQKHGGELSVDSQLGVGTVFTLMLPI